VTLSTATESDSLRYIRTAETSKSETGPKDKNSVDELVGMTSDAELINVD
jgi:hypothetical protein